MKLFRNVILLSSVALTIIIITATMLVFNILPQTFKTKSSISQEKEPNDWMAMQRTYPYNHINPEAVRSAMNQVKQMRDHAIPMTTPWTPTGPENIGGRITDVESPSDNMNTLYIGAATGGVLKSTDAGATWTNLFGALPVISVGDIAIDPNNSSTIYVGTGEANSSSFSFLGNGMYKSTDAGQTWQDIGLNNTAYIGRVLVDYSNSQQIFVAACGHLFSYDSDRGVYRSTNGGQTWQKVLYQTDSTAAIDLVQDPVNPLVLYAAMWERTRGLDYRNSFGSTSGIWKSTDGGTNWSRLTTGLPTGNTVGRIGLTICKTNANVLYASIDMPNNDVRVYKTINAGQTWTRTNDGALNGMFSNFGWYFGQIRVNPQDANQVFVMGVSLFRSNNGGSSWTDLSQTNIHVDHHAMFFDETGNRIVEGNDGGLYVTTTSGNSWDKINNLAITQFYDIDIDYLVPERLYGGTQDNNSIRTLTGNSNDWEAILGGDGMYSRVDYNNSDRIYCEYQYGNLFRSDDLGYNMNYISGPMYGDNVNWSAPLAMDPIDPAILYFGTFRLWKTTNYGSTWTAISNDLTKGGSSWTHTITTLAISPVNPNIVIAGTGDGKVQVSSNGGQTWSDRSAGLPNRWITRVTADPFNDNHIYVTCSGFRMDEPQPHVLKSLNLGQTWVDITSNLPEYPVNDIILDPEVQGRILVGTDAGVYGSTNDGQSWYWIWNELPAVPIYVMKIHNPTRKIVVGTYGLSTYSANLDDLFSGLPITIGMTQIKLTVSPNPITDLSVLHFNLPAGGNVKVRITGLNGETVRMVDVGNLPKGEQTIRINDIESLPSGIYLISVEGKKLRGTVKGIRL